MNKSFKFFVLASLLTAGQVYGKYYQVPTETRSQQQVQRDAIDAAYAFFGLTRGASPREVLGLGPDEELNRGVVVLAHRERIRDWYRARSQTASEEERKELLKLLNASKEALMEEIH